jgi:hypothetical protein
MDGFGCCEGHCVNMVEGLDADANCGYCGAACGELTCCSARCVDLDNDQLNCGECGRVCDGSEACCHGECTALGTSDDCTGCGHECPDGTICVSSSVGCG